MTPLRIAIAGLGGFAKVHHQAVLQLEGQGQLRLVACCDPRADDPAAIPAEFAFPRRGVALHTSLEAMLERHAGELDLITLPTPIPLHAPMHAACVARGVPVYLEKPPTLDPAELEAMIATDRAARIPTWVGFNFISDPVRQAVKRRLLAGEFGRLEEVRIAAVWPRPDSYYARAGWAGRLLVDGRLVLDGPLGNAMAHLAHDGLHWCGNAPDTWGEPAQVRARLMRAHAIAGSDTALVDCRTADRIRLRIAVSHAGTVSEEACETLHCDQATITFRPTAEERCRIVRRDGGIETLTAAAGDGMAGNLARACRTVRDGGGWTATTLADARPFVWLNALAHLATGSITALTDGAYARFLAGSDDDLGASCTPDDLPRLAEAVARL